MPEYDIRDNYGNTVGRLVERGDSDYPDRPRGSKTSPSDIVFGTLVLVVIVPVVVFIQLLLGFAAGSLTRYVWDKGLNAPYSGVFSSHRDTAHVAWSFVGLVVAGIIAILGVWLPAVAFFDSSSRAVKILAVTMGAIVLFVAVFLLDNQLW